MRYGDREGLWKVYTSEGKLILHKGERILDSEADVAPSLKTTWGYFGGDELLAGKGTVYLTNRRFVFIGKGATLTRIASPFAPALGERAGEGEVVEQEIALREITSDKFKSLDVSGTEVREYFEIPIKEILACEIKSGHVPRREFVNAYILSGKSQYHLSFVLRSDSSLLARFRNNQVENVMELTKNIKFHYNNTSWIHLPVKPKDVEYRAR